MEKLRKLAETNMSQEGYKILGLILKDITPIWDRKVSSSGRYHVKANGYVPTILEHTYEMLFCALKIIRLFGYKSKSQQIDVMIMAIILHDSLKYGIENPINNKHTVSAHDKLVGELVTKHKDILEPHLEQDNFWALRHAVSYHSGRWTVNNKIGIKIFGDKRLVSFFVHIMDMLSTNDCLKGE